MNDTIEGVLDEMGLPWKHREGGWVVPCVVEEADRRKARGAFLLADADEPVHALARQRRVGAEGHHEVELRGVVEDVDYLAEQEGQR